MEEMTYEEFIRGAFSIEKDDMLDRYDDPAGLANANIYASGELELVKIGAGYAMEVYNSYLWERCGVSTNDKERMQSIVIEVVNANKKEGIFRLIEEFQDIVDNYYTFPWNRD